MAGGPAARLQLWLNEDIDNKVSSPTLKFTRKGNKSVMTIILGFNIIGNMVEKSEDPVPPDIETNFRDALIDGTNYIGPKDISVKFEPSGNQGDSKITITGTLSTKIPGTGSLLPASRIKKGIPGPRRKK
ncbi:MAG: hypothetical protein ABI402_11435 [Ferruginibacter sp.]